MLASLFTVMAVIASAANGLSHSEVKCKASNVTMVVILRKKVLPDVQRTIVSEILGNGSSLDEWRHGRKSWEKHNGTDFFTTMNQMPSDIVVLHYDGDDANLEMSSSALLKSLEDSEHVKFATQERLCSFDSDSRQKYSDDDPRDVNQDRGRSCSSQTNCSSSKLHFGRRLLANTDERSDNVEDESISSHSRKLRSWGSKLVTDEMNAKELWNLGYSGEGVKVAIFDTGLKGDQQYFRNVVERTIWTNEDSPDDMVGHGTFVAGVVASTNADCPGFAPDAEIHVFKVFTDEQESFTSWFLDAFNYAIHIGVDVLNLSIGGPDFMDEPFVDKVLELTAAGIIMVSAIGNDGPLFGTLNNPGDQGSVIGVGGIDYLDNVAKFSSRGMSTAELPFGYGRFKPDLVAYGSKVRGLSKSYGCKSLSGTSVASPVVTGAVTLLASIAHKERLNPASMKQALLESATRLGENSWGIFEQGQGKINLQKAHQILLDYVPRASVNPPDIDTTDCPYMSPFCDQPIYYSGMPLILNVTILNGMDVYGEISEPPVWIPDSDSDGEMMAVAIQHSRILWPWVGWLSLKLSPTVAAKRWSGIATGYVKLIVTSRPEGILQNSEVVLPLRIKISPTPPRRKRLLWDQYHSLGYPAGYFPRDNLAIKNDPLDWNGDHPHTNFRNVFKSLRSQGFFLEVLGQPFSCFDASEYGALLIVDPEEEYFSEEIEKLAYDVKMRGLGLVVIADWYNHAVVQNIRFFDENTQNWWDAETGGTNVPALNELLQPFDIELGNGVYAGKLQYRNHEADFGTGTHIKRFPAGSHVVSAELRDIEAEITTGASVYSDVVVLGLASSESSQHGRIAVFGDSSCLDEAHTDDPSDLCTWILDLMIEHVVSDNLMPEYRGMFQKLPVTAEFGNAHSARPVRPANSTLYLYSKVITSSQNLKRQIPNCEPISWSRGESNKDLKITHEWRKQYRDLKIHGNDLSIEDGHNVDHSDDLETSLGQHDYVPPWWYLLTVVSFVLCVTTCIRLRVVSRLYQLGSRQLVRYCADQEFQL